MYRVRFGTLTATYDAGVWRTSDADLQKMLRRLSQFVVIGGHIPDPDQYRVRECCKLLSGVIIESPPEPPQVDIPDGLIF